MPPGMLFATRCATAAGAAKSAMYINKNTAAKVDIFLSIMIFLRVQAGRNLQEFRRQLQLGTGTIRRSPRSCQSRIRDDCERDKKTTPSFEGTRVDTLTSGLRYASCGDIMV